MSNSLRHPFIAAVLATKLSADQLPQRFVSQASVGIQFRQTVTLRGHNIKQVRSFVVRIANEHFAHDYLVLLEYNTSNEDCERLVFMARASWRLSIVLYGAAICRNDTFVLPAQLIPLRDEISYWDANILSSIDSTRVRTEEATLSSQDRTTVESACRTLGLANTSASADEAKRAFRALVLQLHPDKHMCDSPAERQRCANAFQAVDKAYRDLCSIRRWPNN
jgi:hypothetical protein